jgi:hypothetical protein
MFAIRDERYPVHLQSENVAKSSGAGGPGECFHPQILCRFG